MDVTKLKRGLNTLVFKGKKYAPEILAISGGIGACAGFVMGCKATLSVPDILEKHHEELKVIEETDSLDEKTADKAVKKVYFNTTKKFVVTYGPAVTVFTLSLGSIFGSTYIFRKRSAEYAGAYAAVSTAYSEYRKRVIEKFGAEADEDIITGKKIVEVPVEGKKRPKKVTTYDDPIDEIDRLYAEGNIGWTKDPTHNKMYLLKCQAMCNERLRDKGYLYLEEVYKMFGYQVTVTSKKAGWIWDPKYNGGEEGRVSFGLDDPTSPGLARFLDGLERNVLLKFNCHPDINNMVADCGYLPEK